MKGLRHPLIRRWDDHWEGDRVPDSLQTPYAGGVDGTTTPLGRLTVAVYARDPILREGAIAQLRCCPEVDLQDPSAKDPSANGPGTVALIIVDTLDEATLAWLRKTVRNEGAPAVLVVSSLCESDLLDVIDCGIATIVWRRQATASSLEEAVRAAAQGDGALPADLLGQLVSQVASLRRNAPGGSGAAGAPQLSPRELEALRLIAEGFDTAEIASKLSYSERTVKNVVHGILARLHMRNRAQAVAHAIRHGYI